MQVWKPNTPLQNGQYIIKRASSGGGFGETYLAEDTEENRLSGSCYAKLLDIPTK